MSSHWSPARTSGETCARRARGGSAGGYLQDEAVVLRGRAEHGLYVGQRPSSPLLPRFCAELHLHGRSPAEPNPGRVMGAHHAPPGSTACKPAQLTAAPAQCSISERCDFSAQAQKQQQGRQHPHRALLHCLCVERNLARGCREWLYRQRLLCSQRPPTTPRAPRYSYATPRQRWTRGAAMRSQEPGPGAWDDGFEPRGFGVRTEHACFACSVSRSSSPAWSLAREHDAPTYRGLSR
jgi:hypothetical protein